MPHKSIDLQKIKTYPIHDRKNLVKYSDLVFPGNRSLIEPSNELIEVADRILKARMANKSIIWMMGAHVIKCGLGPLIIDLMKKGFITHISGNGAVSIHDLELAYIGETSEDVAQSIEDGSFGMAHETGSLIHQALKTGIFNNMGYGEALGAFIDQHNLKYKDISIFYQAYKLGIPATVHVTVGADIIHQHPSCDFGILGAASGLDFKIFCASIAELDQGVFLNFGSAVTGPEIFLKALSIARNLGHQVSNFTTANFDIVDLGDNYRTKINPDKPEYYYRPRKNIVNRPTSIKGKGFHIQGNHLDTIPNLHYLLCKHVQENEKQYQQSQIKDANSLEQIFDMVTQRSPLIENKIKTFVNNYPRLSPLTEALCQSFLRIAETLERGGTLFICGNGGSMADALHISGELMKSFMVQRSLNASLREKFSKDQEGALLGKNLQPGLRAIVLGANLVLNSAINNDFKESHLEFAQELQVLCKPGDVLLGISTSGNAKNVKYAVMTAKALGLQTIVLTGARKSHLSEVADISLHAPQENTALIQQDHIIIYHTLCDLLETYFFADQKIA